VVAGEGVDEIDFAGDMGQRDGDDLTVAGRLRDRGSAFEQIRRIAREKCGGDQFGHVTAAVGSIDDHRHGGWVADRKLMDQVDRFGGHLWSIHGTPDTGLT
jgi:hypothetical protein